MKRHSMKLAIFLCILFILHLVLQSKEGFTPRFIREKKTIRFACFVNYINYIIVNLIRLPSV